MDPETVPTTDKVYGYLPIYRRIFTHLDARPIKLLELGVAEGGSLWTWQEWFPRGTIIGIDRDLKDLKVTHDRIRCYQGLQQDADFLKSVATIEGPFDIIIDDCSHMATPTRIAFWTLFPHLKRGGVYCIEDWGTGYWDHHGFDGAKYAGANHLAGMVGFVKELVDEAGVPSYTDERFGVPPHRASRFSSIEFFPGIVVVRKELYGY